jgi:nucleoside-diphosphate-sugar epimerase
MCAQHRLALFMGLVGVAAGWGTPSFRRPVGRVARTVAQRSAGGLRMDGKYSPAGKGEYTVTSVSDTRPKKVLVLGGDGFCGWPTSLHLSDNGHDVVIVDNLSRRNIDTELGVSSLTPIATPQVRVETWNELTGKNLRFVNIDLAKDYDLLLQLIKHERPDSIVHFAEQRAAPYSMKSSKHKRYTIDNNVGATHNVLAAIVESGLDIHLVHLGARGVCVCRSGRMRGGGRCAVLDSWARAGGGSGACSARGRGPRPRPGARGGFPPLRALARGCHRDCVLSARVPPSLIPAASPGTMGVYGYGNSGGEIPEGYIDVILPGGREKRILHPAYPGSIYHTTKCLDALLFQFYVQNDQLRITDLHQGIVWGTNTPQTSRDERLINRFDYDGDYGTVLNRFLMQGALGIPLTVYGTGGQTRGLIHITDTSKCIELAINNPPKTGSPVEILNQIAQTAMVRNLAELVSKTTGTPLQFVSNPRQEASENPLEVSNKKFKLLGLDPIMLDDAAGLLEEVKSIAEKYKHRCDVQAVVSKSFWNKARANAAASEPGIALGALGAK